MCVCMCVCMCACIYFKFEIRGDTVPVAILFTFNRICSSWHDQVID